MPGMALTDTDTTDAVASSDAVEVIPGQPDVDEVPELVVRDERPPAPAVVSGELVAARGEQRNEKSR